MLLLTIVDVYMQKLADGGEIDLRLLGDALFGESEVIEVSGSMAVYMSLQMKDQKYFEYKFNVDFNYELQQLL